MQTGISGRVESASVFTFQFLFFLNDEPAHAHTNSQSIEVRRARSEEIRENGPRAVICFP